VPEEIIDRMRKDIALKVIGKEAFSVTYKCSGLLLESRRPV